MSTKKVNLSTDFNDLPEEMGKGLTIGIVKSQWNSEITNSLLKGARDTLKKYHAHYLTIEVPGTFELTYGAKDMIRSKEFDAILVLGCVIQGETPHFNYVCDSVTYGITQLNLKSKIPVIFGVLTVNDMQQAIDRAGGKYGNKGVECAIAAIKMAKLKIPRLQ